MKGHVIATAVWLGLIGAGNLLFQQMTRPTVVRSCDSPNGVAEVTATVSPDGHFYIDGAVNGATVRFMVDTGASYVTLGVADANQARLSGGVAARFDTAGGTIDGKVFRDQVVRADCLEVGGATVAVNPLLGDVALLGQNFLRHFEVVQRDRQLVLRRRPNR